MGFRFRKRFKILPGVYLNLSKSGASLSLGAAGATLNVGRHGGENSSRFTFNLPGAGIYYEKRGVLGETKSQKKSDADVDEKTPEVSEVPEQAITKSKLDLSFLDRLVMSPAETAFVDGLRLLNEGNEEAAQEKLRGAVSIADGAILAALLAYYDEKYDAALQYALAAREKVADLGQQFTKYGLDIDLVLPINEDINAQLKPDIEGVMMLLANIYREMGQDRDALAALYTLYQRFPEDLIVRLSLVELLFDHAHEDKELYQKVLELTDKLENETSIHAALLLYRGMAMRRMGLPEVARDVLTTALRKTKDRPEDLLLALRYERALAYNEMGKKSQAEDELKKIYATHSTYEDVAQRLGVAATA